MNANLVGPESLIPLLPYATALSTYHFRPKLPMVWVSLALNVILCAIGVFALVAALFGFAAQPLLAGVFGLFLFVIPCGFNVRNMLQIRRALKQNMAGVGPYEGALTAPESANAAACELSAQRYIRLSLSEP